MSVAPNIQRSTTLDIYIKRNRRWLSSIASSIPVITSIQVSDKHPSSLTGKAINANVATDVHLQVLTGFSQRPGTGVHFDESGNAHQLMRPRLS